MGAIPVAHPIINRYIAMSEELEGASVESEVLEGTSVEEEVNEVTPAYKVLNSEGMEEDAVCDSCQ